MDTATPVLLPVMVCSSAPVPVPEWTRRGLVVLAGPPLALAPADRRPAAIFVDRSAGKFLGVAQQLQQKTGATLVVDSALDAASLDSASDAVIADTLGDPALAAATVAALMRRGVPATLPPAVESYALSPTVTFDISSRCIRREGGVQPLSPTEFRLLQVLHQAKGRPCSHDELVARVWGADRGSGHHYLRLYVRYLRHKIEEEPQHPCLLQNVWGIGYRLLRAPAPGAAPDGQAGNGIWVARSSSLRRRR